MQEEPYNHSFRIGELIRQFINNTLDKDGEQELKGWIAESKANRRLFEELTDKATREQDIKEREAVDWKAAYQRIQGKIEKGRKRRIVIAWVAFAAAAAILVGSVWFFQVERPADNANQAIILQDVPPGGTKARLVLANGSSITLGNHTDSAFTQSTVSVRQQQGKLTYASTGMQAGVAPYNTLVTPRGGMYSLVLADGTKVWLNAASSLKYPVQFAGSQRTVILTGEAYFEVVHKASQPFVVKVNGTEIQDIGTAFNIMAYNDEAALVTTVVDGTVRMETGSDSRLVHKGSSATIHDDDKITLSTANPQQALAWKDNHFRFRNADIATVMRQISRWYDVSVTYQGEVKQHFSGVISRDVNVSIVFQALERTGGVHFTIEGRNITVRP